MPPARKIPFLPAVFPRHFFIRKLSLLVISLFLMVHSYPQEITIYAIPSPKGVNWNSPGKLLFSYITNTFARSRYGKKKHPIGHMMVELKDSTRHALTGATAEPHSGMTKKVISKGHGLAILFDVINGRLDEQEDNLSQLEERSQRGDIAFVRFRINQIVFNRLWQYLQEYKLKGYDKFYNGINKPREGLGAGCSAFAHSFLEVGGLSGVLPSNEWAVNILVPEKLMGGKEKTRHVQFFKLLFASHWADPAKEPYRQLSLYDPTLLYHWILNKYSGINEGDTIRKANLKKANGLVMNCTGIMPPDEPIWVNE